MLFSSDNKDVWDVVQQVRQRHEDILVMFFQVVKEEYIKKRPQHEFRTCLISQHYRTIVRHRDQI